MINSFQELGKRFSVLETVIKFMNLDERDKALLRELFVTVYTAGYEDAEKSRRALEKIATDSEKNS